MPSKRKTTLIFLASIWTSFPGHTAPLAPTVIETGPNGSQTLLACQPGSMPVVTEGPTDEFHNGQRVHSDTGVRKCVDIPGDVPDSDAGGSASVKVAADRWLKAVNCPRGTVPLAWQFENYSLTADARAPIPQRYAVFAPVVVRCIEVTRSAPEKAGR
jgi:hypothetical protein